MEACRGTGINKRPFRWRPEVNHNKWTGVVWRPVAKRRAVAIRKGEPVNSDLKTRVCLGSFQSFSPGQ